MKMRILNPEFFEPPFVSRPIEMECIEDVPVKLRKKPKCGSNFGFTMPTGVFHRRVREKHGGRNCDGNH